mgnify:CR=1 FL=1
MAGYIGTKAVNLSTTGADINGDANVDGSLTVVGDVGIGTTAPSVKAHIAGSLPYTYIDNSAATSGIYGLKLTSGPTPLADFTYSSVTGENKIGGLQSYVFPTFYSGGAERMRIDTSGNVGVNNASPNTKMDIIGSTTTSSGIVDTLRLRHTGVAGNDGARIQFTAGASTSGAAIGSGGQAANSADLRFYAGGNTERMRIDASGGVYVNATALSSTANHWAFSPGNAFSQIGHETGVPSTTPFTRFMYNAGLIGSITQVGTASIAYNTTSDYRLKENITPIVGAADIVKAMRPATYTFKADGTWHDGFLAHELQELHPRAVTGSKDGMVDEEYEVTPAVEATFDDEGVELTPAEDAVMGTRSVPDYQGVDYSKLTPILTAALQEALNKIDELTARIEALEAV